MTKLAFDAPIPPSLRLDAGQLETFKGWSLERPQLCPDVQLPANHVTERSPDRCLRHSSTGAASVS